MPVAFVTEVEARRWGRFEGEPSPEQLERFFYLDPDDLARVAARRTEATRLGFAVQLGTLRFLGTFLTRVEETPAAVVGHMAGQLGVALAAWPAYPASRARLVHVGEIRQAYGYVPYGEEPTHGRFVHWVFDRAWTADDPATKLLDAATGWLVDHKVVLPGVTTMTRLVAHVRDQANQQAWQQLTGSLDLTRTRRLLSLLEVNADTGVSALERLRRPPRNPTIDGLVGALQRLVEIKALGGGGIDTTHLPAGRLRRLAGEALGAKAQKVAQRSPARRLAVLAAFAAVVHRSAHDDVIDVLLLVTRELTNRIHRKAEKERLRTLGDLDAAALTLARAAAVLVDPTVTDGDVRSRVLTDTGAEAIQRAIATVRSITTTPAESLWEGLRSRYPHLNRFFPALVAHVDFDATTAGHPVIKALAHLRLVERGEATIADAPLGIATGTWQPLVCPQEGVVDGRAYRFCLLDRLRSGLGRREVFVPAADRWGDPRRLLMAPDTWKAARPAVLRSLDLDGGARHYLDVVGEELDEAYARAAEIVAGDPGLLIDDEETGRQRLRLRRLEALPEPGSTTQLRDELKTMLSSVELPELLLEVDAWTGFTDAFTHISGAATRLGDHEMSICAVLIAQACNVPYSAVANKDIPALTLGRLAWTEANYLRTDTVAAGNDQLVDYQRRIPVVAHWGGGEVTSADGLRFVVPVRSVSTGANPRYFGTGRGITFLNYVADNYIGWTSLVVPGTLRDSQYILDGLLDNHSSLDPREVMTDTGSDSDLVFGLFKLLGYIFSPRLADLPDRRYFRLDRNADYGVLNRIARHRSNTGLVIEQWDDVCRVAGTLHTRSATASQVIRTLQRSGQPTIVGRAIGEIGRVARTVSMLAGVTSEEHRRRILTQLNRQEGRHSLARDVFHGRRGSLYQAYRTGQERQLGALGLVVNAITLWNSRYTDRAVTVLTDQGRIVDPADIGRISPLHHATISLHGRYTFNLAEPLRKGNLRPLPHSPPDAHA